MIVKYLINIFPSNDVYITTDMIQYFENLGFKNYPALIHEGIPQAVFFVLPFTENVSKGIVVFREGLFKANG